MPQTSGLPTRRGDGCPLGIFRHGVPIGRSAVRLMRGAGAHPRASSGRLHSGPPGGKKDDIARRAKAGYCPCCARPTHVALPSRYAAGEHSGHKARGVQLRRDRGSWAARFFAAVFFARDNGSPSAVWDWADQSWIPKAPALCGGYFGAEPLGTPALPEPPAREPSIGASKPTVLLAGAMPPAQEEIANRCRRPPTRRSPPDNAHSALAHLFPLRRPLSPALPSRVADFVVKRRSNPRASHRVMNPA